VTSHADLNKSLEGYVTDKDKDYLQKLNDELYGKWNLSMLEKNFDAYKDGNIAKTEQSKRDQQQFYRSLEQLSIY